MSKSPAKVRLRRLVSAGYILGSPAVLDPAKLSLDRVSIVGVRLRESTERALKAFSAAARAVPEAGERHMIAGAFDYFPKVRNRDVRHHREALREAISAPPHVSTTSRQVAMEAMQDIAAPKF